MKISEEKIKIAINNYFKAECNIDTSIREAFEKGFRIGVKKAVIAVEPKWIPCSERMPDEHEWLGGMAFGTTISDEVYVTFENPKGERFCKHLSFQNKKLSDYDQHTIDVFYKGSKPIAWMPLPEPYQPDGFTKWAKSVADSYRNDKEKSE